MSNEQEQNLKKPRQIPFEITEPFGKTSLNIQFYDIMEQVKERRTWISDWHSHNYCELIVMLVGKEHLMFEQQSDVTLSPHDICIIPKNINHACYPISDEQNRVCFRISISENKGKATVGDHLISYIFNQLISNQNMPLILNNTESLKNQTNELLTTLQSQSAFSSNIFKHQVIVLILDIFNMIYQKSKIYVPQSTFDTSIYKVDSETIRIHRMEIFFENSGRQALTLQELAGYLHLGIRQTERVVMRHYGMSFKEVINKSRIDISR